MSEEHDHRQLGGYRATLHNPKTSPEAKAHAAAVLTQHGVNLENEIPIATSKLPLAAENALEAGAVPAHVSDTKGNGHGDPHETLDGKDAEHEHRVLGGYKATLHNDNTSEEAKEHAAEVLKHEHHVVGGYKATLHNPNTSEGAK
ncbi:uncharacterized protein I303_105039 [Kwoniella dejecticola CBS 10117]|uniref:Conidiation-specific protein 6 n=1 Tax=Kwoniella dejecticola CBS 10117 TaxID=1296121 RepID=A0A1A6A3M2_9TREE|nr:uncharacterized protein I303_05515 [Kwoniella dejecticola CBS 10117]OBR84656.1 hypothetical protein I303_05515 [Kwoniella dejecticola CBS 10117]